MNRCVNVLSVLLLVASVILMGGCAKLSSTSRQPTHVAVNQTQPRPPTFSLDGTVAKRDGEPVPHAPVSLVLMDTSSSQPKAFIKAQTKANGKGDFFFPSLPVPPRRGFNQYYAVAYLPRQLLGWSSQVYSWDRSERSSLHRQVTMFPLRAYAGRVVDDRGRPIQGALVRFLYPNDSGRHFTCAEVIAAVAKLPCATTTANGRFQLDCIPLGCGEPILEARKDWWAQYPPPYMSDPERIAMVPAGKVAGMFKNDDGTPITGEMIGAEGYFDRYGRTITRQDGSFTLDALPPGSYAIGAMPSPGNLLAKSLRGIKVKAGKITQVGTLVRAVGIPITGKVVDKDTGRPIPYALVKIRSQYPSMVGASLNCDCKGSFAGRLIPGETYTFAYGQALQLYDPREARVVVAVPREAGTYSITLPIQRLITGNGAVVDHTGKPMRNLQVVIPSLQEEYAEGPVIGRTSTDKNGRFEMPLIRKCNIGKAPSRVTIAVRDKECRTLAQQTVEWDGLINGSVVLRLAPNASR